MRTMPSAVPRCLLLLATAVSVVLAAPQASQAVTVDVRIEGATQTLFEGPVETDVRTVRSASDTEDRICDTTNFGANPTAAPSRTGALASAADLGGFDWDATWFGSFDDYGLDRIGPDPTDLVNFRFWTEALNGQLAEAGGCQEPVSDGDEALWAFDGSYFDPDLESLVLNPMLELSGPEVVELGDPLHVDVTDDAGDPVEGASVKGATTDENGTAEITVDTPGLVMLKASKPGTIRSSRIVVCVQENAADDCSDTAPPSCTSASATTTLDTPVSLGLTCEGHDAEFVLLDVPDHGTLSQFDPVSGGVVYTPVAGHVGPDTFRFRARNGAGDSAVATLTINVQAKPIVPIGDPPVPAPPAPPVNQSAPPKPKACASKKGKALKRCKALQKCKKVKKKSKRKKCNASARKIGTKRKRA